MFDNISTFLSDSYIPLITLIVLFIITSYNKNFKKRERDIFFIIFILTSLLLVVTFIDNMIANNLPNEEYLIRTFSPSNKHPMWLVRYIAMDIGYILRPVTLMLSVLLLFPVDKKIMNLCAIPALLNAILFIINPFTSMMCYINCYCYWESGPLYFVYFICYFYYFILFLILYINYYKKLSRIEKVILLAVMVLIAVAAAVDFMSDSSVNSVSKVTIYSLMAYYLCIETSRTNEIIDLQQQKMDVQKRALLNSQIQPHFVYNTLSVIKELCFESPDMAAKCIDDFSNYLRNTNKFGINEGTITVEDEINNCKLFSNIEQIRFPNLSVRYILKDGNYQVPFLTIQPMVENAIRHGVRNTENGKVTVTLSLTEIDNKPYHLIEIKDNGTGKSLINSKIGDHLGIGLPNVKNRVEVLCNGTFDINFTEHGTIVTILIPIENNGLEN